MSERDAVVPSFITVVLSDSFSVRSDSIVMPVVPVPVPVEPVEPVEPVVPVPLADAVLSLIVMVLFVRSSSFTSPWTSLAEVVVPEPEEDDHVPLPDGVEPVVLPVDEPVLPVVEPVEPEVDGSDDMLPWLPCVLVLLCPRSSSLVCDIVEPPVVCAAPGLAARRSPAMPRPITTPNPFRLMCSLPASFDGERKPGAPAHAFQG
ncbi:MAG TPA: hypothetical protein VD838_05435 [Anaeromyxobacteraceae bacterium]|nr:hypothetical protein [Anaeromyxobacteraceae bacterium]